jgi:hypothetical protein
MGFEDVNSGDGYTQFEKGTNVLIKPAELDHGQDSYQGEEYYQLEFVFDAVPENGGEQGRVPAWLTSKITIGDSEEHTSNLGKLLRTTGILDDVLKDLGADDDLVAAIKAGDKRFEATNDEENEHLMQAVAKAIGGIVLRAGTKWNSGEEYSVAKDFYGVSDEDPFADDADEADAETDEGEQVVA